MTDTMKQFDDFSAFRETLCRTHMAWHIRPADRQRYCGRMSAASHGDVTFTELDFEALDGRRGRINAADERIGLTLYLAGGQTFSHGAQEVSTRPGELLLWDAMRPAQVHSSQRTRCITMLMPREAVSRRVASIDRLCGRTIRADSPLAQILAGHLQRVHQSLEQLKDREQRAVIEATLELTFACFQPGDTATMRGRSHEALLERVMRHVRENFEHEDLSPSRVARAFGFSLRTLHLLFAGSGRTFSSFVRDERLAWAARMLGRPDFGELTVTQIGLRAGFCDAAHFSRSFRQRYGRSPLQYRRKDLAG